MSFSNLKYDECEYSKRLTENRSKLEFLLDPIKYENCNKCRIEFGIVGGTDVSQVKGNLVDMENELYGLTYSASLCPSKKFLPQCKDKNISYEGRGCSGKRTIDTNLIHLPSCQMVDYKSIPLPPPMVFTGCAYPSIREVKPSTCQSFMNSYSKF